MAREYFYTYKQYLDEKHGEKIWRLPLSTGIPCVNKLDGKKGCTFCDDTTFTPEYTRDDETLERQIERGVKFYGERYKVKHYYGFFQSNTNTYGPIDKLLEMFEFVLSQDMFKGIAISTRPDYIDESIVNRLQQLNKKYNKDFWIELGLQSVNDRTLLRINRNHTYSDFVNAVNIINNNSDIKITTHMILGLPGESETDIVDGFRTLFRDNKIHALKLRILDIIEGTTMEKEYSSNPDDFLHFNYDSFVNLMANIIEVIPPDIVIMRFINFASLSRILKEGKRPDKDAVLKSIENLLAVRGSRQGAKYEPS